MSQTFDDAASMVAALRPEEPVYCLRPAVLHAAARRFTESFPGDVLYAVKCNDRKEVLEALFDGGIRQFDVASLGEVEAVAAISGETVSHYMHPIKNRRAIRVAYDRYRVRSFALDHADELAKILGETGGATDMTLVVRLEAPRFQAVCDLGGKFGASVEDAAALLRAVAETGNRPGLTFHVGSQCLKPGAYAAALEIAGRAIALSGVEIAVLDVGGGFPTAYADVEPPPLEAYIEAIRAGVAKLGLPPGCRLVCEPGRALVGDAASLVVKVDFRRGDAIYINDGVYGGLADMKYFGTVYPMRLVRPDGPAPSGRLRPFSLFGPTCDSYDTLSGPFPLPEDAREGDWIEMGQIGAYSNVLQTRFNGFSADRFVTVRDGAFLPVRSGPPIARAA